MPVFLAPDGSVTEPCGRVPSDVVELKKPNGRAKPPPFTVPIVGRRCGRALNIDAPPGKRVSLTWRFDGPTLHNITLANGPRGFSSENLSAGRSFKKKLTVPGTYQLFCGLHPVDMTATIEVKGRKK